MNQHREERDWLDDALEQHQLPEARDRYKASLRQAFVAGTISKAETTEVFRAKLRRRFVDGRLEKKPNPLRILRYVLPLAAALVLMVTLLETGIGGARGWEVLELAPDASMLGGISDWQEIHTGKDRLRLGYGASVFVEIGASSRVERIGGAGAERLHAREGSLVFTAREGEKPIKFLIETPDVVIEISSNSVGVDVYESGTCVCVLEGEVIVTPRVGEAESFTVGPGCSCFIEKNGVLHAKQSIADSHSRPITDLVQFSGL